MKTLIIRLSSLGDIVQCMAAARAIKNAHPDSELHWFVRSDFHVLLPYNKDIDKIHSFDRKLGLTGLVAFAWALRKENYTHIYDAHNNVRSHIISFLLKLFKSPLFLRRSKERWKRFLLFKLGKNKFPKPYYSRQSYVAPLKKWLSLPEQLNTSDSFKLNVNDSFNDISQKILIAPSAAWEMKRWPVEHWKALVTELKEKQFVITGGPQDDFCKELESAAPDRVSNCAGQWNWAETFMAVSQAGLIISGDTGVLHMADLLERPTLALIGPTAFGFPQSKSSQILEQDLACRPCSKDGRGGCTNKVYKKCMIDITPQRVAEAARGML